MWTSEAFLPALRLVVLSSFAMCAAALLHALLTFKRYEPSLLGRRGRQRVRLRARSPLFAALEPSLLRLAAPVQAIARKRQLDAVERLLLSAGEPGGFGAAEVIALSLVLSLAGACACVLLEGVMEVGAAGVSVIALVGSLFPFMRLDALAKERAKSLERSLPSAIDLCVLCMGAGSDFPSALAFAVAELGSEHEVCVEELSLVLEHLTLGRTRVEALKAFADRARSRVVGQLVAAICQSDQKGSPLVEALTIQANALREQRGVLAEELAARAGVKMMIPLMLMVMSLLLVIFGPFIVNGVGL